MVNLKKNATVKDYELQYLFVFYLFFLFFFSDVKRIKIQIPKIESSLSYIMHIPATLIR